LFRKPYNDAQSLIISALFNRYYPITKH